MHDQSITRSTCFAHARFDTHPAAPETTWRPRAKDEVIFPRVAAVDKERSSSNALASPPVRRAVE